MIQWFNKGILNWIIYLNFLKMESTSLSELESYALPFVKQGKKDKHSATSKSRSFDFTVGAIPTAS